MSLRISKCIWLAAFALPLLSSCGDGATDAAGAPADVSATGGSPDAMTDANDSATKISCALNGSTELKPVCSQTVIEGEVGTQLLLQGPEGDFRRFNIVPGGRGLEPSDGAEPATINIIESNRIEVVVGKDRFILPAKIQADTAPASDPAPKVDKVDTPAAPPAAGQ